MPFMLQLCSNYAHPLSLLSLLSSQIMSRKRTKVINKDRAPTSNTGVGRVVIDLHDEGVLISSPRQVQLLLL